MGAVMSLACSSILSLDSVNSSSSAMESRDSFLWGPMARTAATPCPCRLCSLLQGAKLRRGERPQGLKSGLPKLGRPLQRLQFRCPRKLATATPPHAASPGADQALAAAASPFPDGGKAPVGDREMPGVRQQIAS